ncbi:hypothetical protein [Halocalculus aciditolerans]|uniref:Uncharacterized protein n=1 Tax=Halocalculus aciditolerans TaxID=1383812 RepID=A0A830FJH9_9EURY|nr:hypothetical protein [Halocalculus aciditolerans]GGL58765.1 hypothetical protein GCM10009039_16260 [Halocalculus aciditolerans]
MTTEQGCGQIALSLVNRLSDPVAGRSNYALSSRPPQAVVQLASTTFAYQLSG